MVFWVEFDAVSVLNPVPQSKGEMFYIHDASSRMPRASRRMHRVSWTALKTAGSNSADFDCSTA